MKNQKHEKHQIKESKTIKHRNRKRITFAETNNIVSILVTIAYRYPRESTAEDKKRETMVLRREEQRLTESLHAYKH